LTQASAATCGYPLFPGGGVQTVFPFMTLADKIEKIDHLLTINELAALISLSAKTLYSKVAAGTIPTIRISGSLRFDPVMIADWLRAQTAKAA